MNLDPARRSRLQVVPAIEYTVLVVDDQSTSRAILGEVIRGISDDISILSFDKPRLALEWAAHCDADLVLVDYGMPDMDGIEFVTELRSLPHYVHVPVVMITAYDEKKLCYTALDSGVSDFLVKPIDPRECQARCRNLLALHNKRLRLEGMVQEATREVRQREKETLFRLARLGEYRNEENGSPVFRMARYSHLIARALGLSAEEAETIEMAAPLHDIGNIGVPESILLKPGKLSAAERGEMQKHPLIGYEILKDSPSKYLRMGALIALSHHEKWDGSGYPHGLVGDHIPLPARIGAIADVYDAMTSPRPYKQASGSEEAFAFLTEQAGKHFDGALVEAFLQARPEVLQIQGQYGATSA